ncbi:MAG: AI-2E family transporter [Synergistaceae bacterium]|nr:AI-2E family transporter [Synergistaceae bacterium]
MDKNIKHVLQNIESKDNRGPFILFLAIFALLAWQAMQPLMTAVIWAGMLSFIATPVFRRISALMGGKTRSVSAGVTLILLAVVFLVPILVVLTSLGSEVTGFGLDISRFLSKMEIGETKNVAAFIPSWLPQWAAEYVRSFLNNSEAITTVVRKTAEWIGNLLTKTSGQLIQGISSFLFHSMVTLMVSFFFIRDGEALVEYIKSVTPLSADEKEFFFSRAGKLLHSIIYGILLTVAIQALLGGLGWWFVGLGSPAFFGMLMFFFGVFPAGTAVVWVPGGLYLLLTGDIKNGIILLVWGTAIVGTIDNLLRPLLISGGSRGEDIPTLLIILGLFGGVAKWGFLGIFLGPLVLVLFTLVFDIYRNRWLKRADGSLE